MSLRLKSSRLQNRVHMPPILGARISENCLEGTGQWVLEKDEYRDWRSPSVSTLLLLRVSVRYCMPPSLDGLSS